MDHHSSLRPLAFLQEVSSLSHTNLVTHLINIFKIRLGLNKEVDSQTIYRISSYSCRGNYSFLNS